MRPAYRFVHNPHFAGRCGVYSTLSLVPVRNPSR